MSLRPLTGLLAALSPVLLAACSASPDRTPAPASERDYVFVFIKTGPATGLTPEAQREAFAGHFSNMERLADEGELLIAGPFMDPRAPDHRGLFVIDEPTVEAGMVHAATDPTTVAGIFVLEGRLFTTDAPLTRLLGLEKEDEARRLADPDIPDEWSGRRYVLATARFDAGLYERAKAADGVLIAGRLHGAGPGAGTRCWRGWTRKTLKRRRGCCRRGGSGRCMGGSGRGWWRRWGGRDARNVTWFRVDSSFVGLLAAGIAP